MRNIFAVLFFILCWSFISFAQTSPVPASSPQAIVATVSAPPAAQTGALAWIESHGGFQIAVLGLVTSFFAILSGVRQLLYMLDGVKQGDPIPTDKSSLTMVNKICLILGKIIDIITANLPH